MTQPRLARHLTIKKRHPAWLGHYPSPSFWEPWHMSLLGHGGVAASQRPTTFMESLYDTNRLATPAAEHLLLFEARTVFGHLPGEMRCTRDLLLDFLDESARVVDLATLWGDLAHHASKHLNADEGPHMNAAARALRAYVERQSTASPSVLDPLLPKAVVDQDGYARLARAVLFVAMMPRTPLLFTLYCSRSNDYAPYTALTVNIDVPLSFLGAQGSRTPAR